MKRYNIDDISMGMAIVSSTLEDITILVRVGQDVTEFTLPRKLLKANITDNGLVQTLINYLIKEK